MFYQKNNCGKIIAYGINKFSNDCIETTNKIVRNIDGEFVFEVETLTEEYISRKSEDEQRERLRELRYKRMHDCFPIINRGQLWHTRLTDEQKAELDAWYDAWLNVTDTLQIPTKPAWLN